jgi:hypothetical protein
MSVADATSGTVSVGVFRYPTGAPFTLNIRIPNHESYDLTDKYVEVYFTKKCEGPAPLLFKASTDTLTGLVSISDGGTEDQSIAIFINTSAVSEHDENSIFSRKVAVENLPVEFAIDVKESSSSDLSWRIQGDLIWQKKPGKFDP